MLIYPRFEAFLNHYCPTSSPLLLAFSGGADSLCLFYCLLSYRKRRGILFHVAHVDHGWREESQQEAESLQKLAANYEVPFHLKRLNPSLLKGNLEAASREARYVFFSSLSLEYRYQAVLTGHHENDQAETIFKRILEGSHWSHWAGLSPEISLFGVRVLRPLLKMPKKEIRDYLECANIIPFEDPTNCQLKYLRARFRESLFPRLNSEFGKEVQGSLLKIGEEAQELTAYFKERLAPFSQQVVRGPWGSALDLQKNLPLSALEMKFLIRFLCDQEGFFLSRTIIDQAATELKKGSANRRFEMGKWRIVVDRFRLFILKPCMLEESFDSQSLYANIQQWGRWMLTTSKDLYLKDHELSSWKQAWHGRLKCSLPLGEYQISCYDKLSCFPLLKKRWTEAKIPSFLYDFFPVIKENSLVCHEFLTGKQMTKLKEGDPCLKIDMTYVI